MVASRQMVVGFGLGAVEVEVEVGGCMPVGMAAVAEGNIAVVEAAGIVAMLDFLAVCYVRY